MLVPLFRKQPEPVSMAANCCGFCIEKEVAGTERGDEEMEQRLPFSTINPLHCVDLNTELNSQLNV